MFRKLPAAGAAAVTLSALLLTGCTAGSDPAAGPSSSSTTGKGHTTYPLTVQNCGHKLTFDAPPKRVVVLRDSVRTDMIAMGLANRIILTSGLNDDSDVPGIAKQAAKLKRVPPTQMPSAEAMLGLNPDFVIGARGASFSKTAGRATRDDLASIGANAYAPVHDCADDPTKETAKAETINDAYTEIALIGQIFDVQPKADKLIATMKSQLAQASEEAKGKPAVKVAVVDPASGQTKGPLGGMANGGVIVWNLGIINDLITSAGGQNAYSNISGSSTRLSQEQFLTTPVDCYVVDSYIGGPDHDAVKRYFTRTYPDQPASKNGCFVFLNEATQAGIADGHAALTLVKALHP